MTPPASTCETTSSLRVYSLPGSCSGTTCSYASSLVTCPGGCANGACTGSGWTQQNSGTTQDLHAVWGSSANAVWAAGDFGTLLFWNGAGWQARVSPTTQSLWSLGGASASSVFAASDVSSSQFAFLHFDGASWTNLSTALNLGALPLWWPAFACVAGLGPKDGLLAIVEQRQGSGSGLTPTRVLYRVRENAGTWTRTAVGEFPLSSGSAGDPCSVQVLGANDYVVSGLTTMRWTGAAFSTYGATAVSTRGLYAATATDAVGILGSSSVRVLVAGAWGTVNVGFNAQSVHGTSATRAFIVGGTGPYGGPYAPKVSLWDGLGVSALTLPTAAAGYLNAVWAASTGEVVAVGDRGLILRGP